MVSFDERVTLVEHLDELRRRIVISAIALAVGDDRRRRAQRLRLRVAAPPAQGVAGGAPHKIITFGPAEPFMVSLKVWAYMGVDPRLAGR